MKNSTNKSTNRNAAFNVVNEQVLAGLKAEGLKWFKPWRMPNGDIYSPVNWVTGRAYNGINALLLSSVARLEGYTSGEWATFKNISDNGGQIRKGEKGTGIVYWVQSFRNKETGAFYPTEKALNKAGFSKNDDVIEDIWSLKYYKVFNIEQADGIESKVPVNAEPVEVAPIPQAEDIYNNYPNAPKLKHGGNEAYYSPSFDKVQMPEAKYFVDVDSYYKTLFHELIHSTGHESRLKREGVVKHDGFGSELYSKEELVAEIGAWYLAGLCNLDPKDGAFNSQAYINGWVKHLENKEREVVYAMSQAQKAVNHILEGKGAETPEPSKKVSKEPVLASNQVSVKSQALNKFDHECIQQAKGDIRAIDHCLNHFNLERGTKAQLERIRTEAVDDLIHTYNKPDAIDNLTITTENGDSKNEIPLIKYLNNIYQKNVVKLQDFTIFDMLQGEQAIAVVEVDECEYYYIYNTTFGGEPAIGYVNIYRNEFKLSSKQVTINYVKEVCDSHGYKYFDADTMRFFNQKLSDFKIYPIGGNKYYLEAPSYWDGELMGYSCQIYNDAEGTLEDSRLDDDEKLLPIEQKLEAVKEKQEARLSSRQVTINGEQYSIDNEKLAIAKMSQKATLDERDHVEAIRRSWNTKETPEYFKLCKSLFKNIAKEITLNLSKDFEVVISNDSEGDRGRFLVKFDNHGETERIYLGLYFEMLRLCENGELKDFYNDLIEGTVYAFGLSTKLESYTTTGWTFEAQAGIIKKPQDKNLEHKRAQKRDYINQVLRNIAQQYIKRADKAFIKPYVELLLVREAMDTIRKTCNNLALEKSKADNEAFFNNFLESGRVLNDAFHFERRGYYDDSNKLKGCSDEIPSAKSSKQKVWTARIEGYNDSKKKASLILTVQLTKHSYSYNAVNPEHNTWEEVYNVDKEALKEFIIYKRRSALRELRESQEKADALEKQEARLNSKQVTIYEQGICPNCGGEELEYEGIKINTCGEHIHYPFECRECGSTGDEYYKLEYVDTVGHRKNDDSESRLHSRQVTINAPKVELKEISSYGEIVEMEGVFEVEQEGKYIATVYALGRWDDNGSREMQVRRYSSYEVLYKEEDGVEIHSTGDLSKETIAKLWESLEEEL